MPDLPEPTDSRSAGGPGPDPRVRLARRRLAGDGSAAQPRTGKPVQVSGTVEQAVEGSHLVLRDQFSGTWFALIGGDPAVVRVDQMITVRGVRMGPDSSFRQQGVPLRVESAWAGPSEDPRTVCS